MPVGTVELRGCLAATSRLQETHEKNTGEASGPKCLCPCQQGREEKPEKKECFRLA